MHRINLEDYEIRTDLALDVISDKENVKKYKTNGIEVTKIKLDKNNNFNKKEGLYITLEFDDVTDSEYKNKVAEAFKIELDNILKEIGYNLTKKACVIGLGNINSTPDSLGPQVIKDIIVTNHLFNMNLDVDKNFSKVLSFSPGVTGQTGIETKNYIKAIIDSEKPDIVILIDSLSSNSISRINKSIQITDSGIIPGSGVGNKRCEITKESLGVPVIAIGVPTVVSASVIVTDTINYMLKNYSYNKIFLKSKASRLTFNNVNYLNKDINIKEDDRKTLLGLIGALSYEELYNLASEVLTPIGYNLTVTTKEIDFIIEKLSEIISYGINNSLHKL